jgi:hypothetical protein
MKEDRKMECRYNGKMEEWKGGKKTWPKIFYG